MPIPRTASTDFKSPLTRMKILSLAVSMLPAESMLFCCCSVRTISIGSMPSVASLRWEISM